MRAIEIKNTAGQVIYRLIPPADLRKSASKSYAAVHALHAGASLRNADLRRVDFRMFDFADRGLFPTQPDLRGADLTGALLGPSGLNGARV